MTAPRRKSRQIVFESGDGPIHGPQLDTADRIEIGTTPATPEARAAFSPHELAARLEAMAELAANGAPMHEDTRGQCWGCGKLPPLASKGIMQPSSMPGWVVRPQANAARFKAPEVWCPECAAMGGFGAVQKRDE